MHTFETTDVNATIVDVTEVSTPTVEAFREYVGTRDQAGTVARWHDEDGNVIAEAAESFGFILHLPMTCGTCGHRYADNTPAGRCPKELEHAVDPDFRAEQHVKIYLDWDDVKGKWTLSPTVMQGDPLDSEHYDAYCDVPDPTPAEYAVLDRANQADLPTGPEVTAMLVAYLAEHYVWEQPNRG